jgi:peptidyl-tRNA hydrolase
MRNAPNDYRLYILMRTDLQSMNAGKGMAQAAHASNQFVHLNPKENSVKLWQRQTQWGFGTTIVLGATKDQLTESFMIAKHCQGVLTGLVVDPTYPYIVSKEVFDLLPESVHTSTPVVKDDGSVFLCRKEVTCGYVFLSTDCPDKDRILGKLKLHP